jgi:hypothetical protein
VRKSHEGVGEETSGRETRIIIERGDMCMLNKRVNVSGRLFLRYEEFSKVLGVDGKELFPSN